LTSLENPVIPPLAPRIDDRSIIMPRSIRDIAITLVLIGGGLLILFSSPTKPEGGPASGFVYMVLRPFQETASSVHAHIKNVWEGYIRLTGVREENRALKQQISRLRQERDELLNNENENRRLRKLLSLKTKHEFPTLVAQIIGEDAAGWYRTVFINRGTDEGVRSDMPVTMSEGLVGRIINSSTGVSRVLLLTDPNLSADCRVVRTRDRGVLTGSLEHGCILRYISLKSEIRPGDEVVTSGMDGVFPRGLPVGKIESVGHGDQGLFLEAQVKSAVDFSALEEVLVILGQQGGFDVRPGLEDNR
jgi:rod shape-determining protein MreC